MGLDVVTLGEPLGVFAATQAGHLRPGGTAHFAVGGAELNVAVGLSRLGHRVGLAGRVGQDAVGRAVTSVLRSEGVDHRELHVDPGAPTGLYIKETAGLGAARVSYHREGTASTRLSLEHVDLDYLLSGTVLHLSGITPLISQTAADLVTHLMSEARSRDVCISFDANIRHRLLRHRDPRKTLGEYVESADVLFLSAEEGAVLLGFTTPAGASSVFGSLRARLLVVHDSTEIYAVDSDGLHSVRAREVSVADTVGAGDALVAGFLSGLVRGWDVPDRLRLAEVCAAHVVSVAGDHEGFPEETVALSDLGLTASEAER